MAVKPSNCVDSIADKLITSEVIDLSGATAAVVLPFADILDDYDVVGLSLLVTVDYVAAEVTNIRVGNIADDDKFAADQSLGAALVAAGSQIPLVLTATPKLTKGEVVEVTHTQVAGQTGEGRLVARLRPHDRASGNRTKRPNAAQSTV